MACQGFRRDTAPSRFTPRHHAATHKAKIFSQIGKQDPDVRPLLDGVQASAAPLSAERDIRRFALKFYTEEGKLGRRLATIHRLFFFRDPLRFPRPQPRHQA